MLTDRKIDSLEKMIPEDTEGEDLRAAYSVLAGVRESKSMKEISSYYSVDINLVDKWVNFFNLSNTSKPVSAKRGRKSKDITSYVKSNIGKIVTPKSVSEELGISLPTFYNFYNANRGWFKKIKRGEFEIVDNDLNRDQDFQ